MKKKKIPASDRCCDICSNVRSEQTKTNQDNSVIHIID